MVYKWVSEEQGSRDLSAANAGVKPNPASRAVSGALASGRITRQLISNLQDVEPVSPYGYVRSVEGTI